MLNNKFKHILSNTTNKVLKSRYMNEIKWIDRVNRITNNKSAIIRWVGNNLKGNEFKKLNYLLNKDSIY